MSSVIRIRLLRYLELARIWALHTLIVSLRRSHILLRAEQGLRSPETGISPKVQSTDEERRLKDEDNLYVTVGRALSLWAAMETGLIEVAAILMGTNNKVSGIVMYSIINFGVWLSVISELFSVNPGYASYKASWNKIADRLRKLKDARDRLAHQTSFFETDSKDLLVHPALRPATYDLRQKSVKFAPLTVLEIRIFAEKVFNLVDDLDTLLQAMAGSTRPDA